MNILDSGGTGFIGSHTCASLLRAGHAVYMGDNLRESIIYIID